MSSDSVENVIRDIAKNIMNMVKFDEHFQPGCEITENGIENRVICEWFDTVDAYSDQSRGFLCFLVQARIRAIPEVATIFDRVLKGAFERTVTESASTLTVYNRIVKNIANGS